MIELHLGDCLNVLPAMPKMNVDAIITDPPYGLSFMNKNWDYSVPDVEFWKAMIEVAKPGAYLLAFGGTRTYHRLMCAIEDAGWEIRDCIMWVYGSGFPKGANVSKLIDKTLGAEREVIGKSNGGLHRGNKATVGSFTGQHAITAPTTDAARQWNGWNTALKPAWEPIIVARKPLAGTIAENVLTYGTGGINIDACRVVYDTTVEDTRVKLHLNQSNRIRVNASKFAGSSDDTALLGRWPANFIHDGSDEVLELFPETGNGNTNSASAARFFYCAKASRSERDEGCEQIEERMMVRYSKKGQDPLPQQKPSLPVPQRNHHPTVKPIALMRYLCKLVTPPNGIILDPFMGSGSTGKAAVLEGFNFIGIEQQSEYFEIAKARITQADPHIQLSLY